MTMAGGGPLEDREIVELDAVLEAVSEPYDPLDVVMLDGFLVGLLLQPEPVLPSQWLPYVFDSEGRAEAMATAGNQLARISELILRQHNYLAACINAREAFDPIVFPLLDEAGEEVTGAAGVAALAPWATGFMSAIDRFPQLLDRHGADPALAESLVGILRHLPVDAEESSDEARRFAEDKRRIERDMPLEDLDDAIDHLNECVLDIADLSRPRKPVERAAPKVGRNDPCPCGSGRKYKQCHGAPN